jgi:hypothetical protein
MGVFKVFRDYAEPPKARQFLSLIVGLAILVYFIGGRTLSEWFLLLWRHSEYAAFFLIFVIVVLIAETLRRLSEFQKKKAIAKEKKAKKLRKKSKKNEGKSNTIYTYLSYSSMLLIGFFLIHTGLLDEAVDFYHDLKLEIQEREWFEKDQAEDGDYTEQTTHKTVHVEHNEIDYKVYYEGLLQQYNADMARMDARIEQMQKTIDSLRVKKPNTPVVSLGLSKSEFVWTPAE